MSSDPRHPARPKGQLTCSNCGRINLRPPDALAMRCDFCAAFASVDPERLRLPGPGAEWPPGAPGRDLADARLHELNVALYQASDQPTRRRWLIQEQTGLSALLHPQGVLPSYQALPLERWIDAAERATRAVERDPAVARLQGELTARAGEFVACSASLAAARGGDRDDRRVETIAAAELLLEAAEAYYRALHRSSAFTGVATDHPETAALARDQVRVILAQHAGQLSREIADRICVEVLGELVAEDAPDCPACHAPLSATSMERAECTRCRRPLELFDEHGWLERQVAWWLRAVAPDRPDSELATSAMQWILKLHAPESEPPDAGDVMWFLRRAVPYVSAEELGLACRLSHHLAGERQVMVAVIAEVERALDDWQPDPQARPERPTRVSSSEIWRRRVVAQWQLFRAGTSAAGESSESSAETLVQMVVGGVYTTGPVPPEVVLELFRHIEPPIEYGALHDAVSSAHGLYRLGESEIGEFLASVLQLMEG